MLTAIFLTISILSTVEIHLVSAQCPFQARCLDCGLFSSTACVSETQFLQCVNGIIKWEAFDRCDAGFVCADAPGTCVEEGTKPASCNLCRACNDPDGLVCTSSVTYAMCVGDTIDAASESYCQEGWYCDAAGTVSEPCVPAGNFTAIPCTADQVSITTTPATTTTMATTTTPTTTTSTTTTTVNPVSFCSSRPAGRYPDPDDTTCKSYIYCRFFNGAMTGSRYTCAGTTYFDPSVSLCSDTYLCPTSTASTTPQTTVTQPQTTATMPPQTTTTTVPTTMTTPSTTMPSTTTTTQGSGTTVNPVTFCSSRPAGRYPEPGDTTCKNYLYCRFYNGAMTGSQYTCTGETLFDPVVGLCSNTYVCGS